MDVDLFGIDDPASLSKLQGPEYALIWLEEPAPMADKANAGLSEEVFNAALVRATRQKNTWHWREIGQALALPTCSAVSFSGGK
ncbi:MAG: hypothetical protein QXT73_06985 [Candidatus Methanomethylicaceae archaeon]